jgi:hypothetical protein
MALARAQATEPVKIYELSTTDGEPAPPFSRLVYECDIRIVGREAVVLLDTKQRGLPFTFLVPAKPSTALEQAVVGLGKSGKRVVCDPEAGIVIWVTVRTVRPA